MRGLVLRRSGRRRARADIMGADGAACSESQAKRSTGRSQEAERMTKERGFVSHLMGSLWQ